MGPLADKADLSGFQPLGTPPGTSGGVAASKRGRLRRYALPLALALAVLLSAVQLLGVLLRDRLGGRIPNSTNERIIAVLDELAPKRAESHEQTGRGFGIAEIPVGEPPNGEGHAQPPHSAAPAPVHGQAEPAAPPPHAENVKPKLEKPPAPHEAKVPPKTAAEPRRIAKKEAVPTARPKEAQPAPKVKEAAHAAPTAAKVEPAPQPTPVQPAPPARIVITNPPADKAKFRADVAGGFAVAVGAFNSQRLATLMEERLDDLGYPHFRVTTSKEARAFALTISAASETVLAKAAKELSDAGFHPAKGDGTLALTLVAEEDANKAKAIAEGAGGAGTLQRTVGKVPLWRIMVGPTSSENAQKAQERLKAEGMDCVIVRTKQ